MDEYDPFARGRHPVGVRTIDAVDPKRDRRFPVEIWYPAAMSHQGEDIGPGTRDTFRVPALDALRSQTAVRNAAGHPGRSPLILFSHPSGSHRRAATFLCTHLGSHGYVVAAMDHSEVVAKDLARRDGENSAQQAARVDAIIASRVPDVRFLLDHLLGAVNPFEANIDADRIGIVGHSFGGWTALAATEVEPRIKAVVALAPGGSSRTKPGILSLKLAFAWGRDVPALFLVAEDDVSLPLAGMREIFDRTPPTKRMLILRRADHCHFMDNVEETHESLRTTPWTGDLAWLNDMRPIAELCSGERAHVFVRGLALCHLDATLRQHAGAQRLLRSDWRAEFARRGIDAIVHSP